MIVRRFHELALLGRGVEGGALVHALEQIDEKVKARCERTRDVLARGSASQSNFGICSNSAEVSLETDFGCYIN